MRYRLLHNRFLQAAVGTGIGVLFLALAFRHHSWEELKNLTLSVRPAWVAASAATYFATMAVRALRWRLLLRPSAPHAGFRTVGEILVLGYAVNNLLPARLGELFRADYAKRRLAISRSAVLGSIFVERAMDGLTVVGLLAFGLLVLRSGSAASSDHISLLWRIAAVGGILFGAAAGTALLIGRRRVSDETTASSGLRRRLEDFRHSMATVRHATALPAALLSLLIWLGEAGALFCILLALGISLGPAALLVITGAVSLSTLIPSAPGYLGTFQYAFYLALSAVGADGAAGVVAATLAQVFLFGGLTVLAAAIHFRYALRQSLGHACAQREEAGGPSDRCRSPMMGPSSRRAPWPR
jgi:uncharacterized protein (TIRG00374 family)